VLKLQMSEPVLDIHLLVRVETSGVLLLHRNSGVHVGTRLLVLEILRVDLLRRVLIWDLLLDVRILRLLVL
jgi:hypothetical protein